MLPQKVIGIEQIDDTSINHSQVDFRPIVTFLVWLVFTIAALGVATSCDESGMYQGPNDHSPRYGGPR